MNLVKWIGWFALIAFGGAFVVLGLFGKKGSIRIFTGDETVLTVLMAIGGTLLAAALVLVGTGWLTEGGSAPPTHCRAFALCRHDPKAWPVLRGATVRSAWGLWGRRGRWWGSHSPPRGGSSRCRAQYRWLRP